MTRETYERVQSSADPMDRVEIGCNECDTYISVRQADEDPLCYLGWHDLGDDGVLCPVCGSNAREEEPREGVGDDGGHLQR